MHLKHMELHTDERVAIITGASSGIGEATARCLGRAGFTVVLAARRAELLERIAAEITQDGGCAVPMATDLADGPQTSELVKRALDNLGRVDVLVNNAGYAPPFALEQLDRDALRHVFDVNLLSAMQLIGEVTPIMRAQGGGRIINISSLTRYVGAPIASAYASTKGGMEAMTACMRLELAPWHIQLSVIVPGFVDTPTFDKSREAGQHLRDDPSNPYRDLMAHLDDFSAQQEKRAVAPEAVAKVVLEAVTAQRPRARYYVPLSARIAAGAFGLMPDSLAERILRRMYKWG